MACYNPYYITRVGISSPLKTAKNQGGALGHCSLGQQNLASKQLKKVIMSHDCVFFFKMDFPG